jgi:hypothetical protein
MRGRPGHRARLENGLKLDINRLLRRGDIAPGSHRSFALGWSRDGERIASAIITAELRDPEDAWLRVQLGSLTQRIYIAGRRCHFGGRQWYFICPHLNKRVSVLWKPPGAHSFACRQRWRGQVAYASQFLDRDNRAHRGKAKINRRLCEIGGFDPDDWDFPPKPKWMRWQTYRRMEARFDRYDAELDEGIIRLVARLGFGV